MVELLAGAADGAVGELVATPLLTVEGFATGLLLFGERAAGSSTVGFGETDASMLDAADRGGTPAACGWGEGGDSDVVVVVCFDTLARAVTAASINPSSR